MRYEIVSPNQESAILLIFDWYNFRHWIVKVFTVPDLDELWDKFRRNYCPTRITRYGKVGRKLLGDDRTIFERGCDIVSDYLEYRRDCERNVRASIWNGIKPYFDWNLGVKITNLSQIKEIEKKTGKQLIAWKDVEVERAKAKRYKEEDQINRYAKGIKDIFSNIQKGHSYIKENRQKREEINRYYREGGQ